VTSTVRVSLDGPVAVVTLDRPAVRNAVDGPTTAQLCAAFDQVERSPDIRAAILTGAGDRAFCAGMDLTAFAESGLAGIATGYGFGGLTRRRRSTPLVAAVNGPAVGGGFELVLACDLVVAAEHAFFQFPEVTRGLFPASGGAVGIADRLPWPVAMETLLLGRRLDAPAAAAHGLVNAVVPAADLMPAALELAGRLADLPPAGLRAALTVAQAAVADGRAAAWAVNDALDRAVFGTPPDRPGEDGGAR
jgi:enoyl-CoA hydratase/carnithine racemase